MEEECWPSTIPVSPESDNLILDVVVFPFATMLSSILNYPTLNKLKTLVVNPTDRFGWYESPDSWLDKGALGNGTKTHTTNPFMTLKKF
jgi:hypothetical protein